MDLREGRIWLWNYYNLWIWNKNSSKLQASNPLRRNITNFLHFLTLLSELSKGQFRLLRRRASWAKDIQRTLSVVLPEVLYGHSLTTLDQDHHAWDSCDSNHCIPSCVHGSDEFPRRIRPWSRNSAHIQPQELWDHIWTRWWAISIKSSLLGRSAR